MSGTTLQPDLPRRMFRKDRHQSAIRELRSGIEVLQQRLARAVRSLDAGEGLDEHLIANAAMLTAAIAKYNLTRDLKGFEEEEPAAP